MSNFFSRLTTLSSISLLIVIVVMRLCLLDYSDLVDPTESRYASVAQIMIIDSDWVTPKLPQPEGVIPYLGKPPLHFWMTALSYKVFGFTNFASRLPGLFSAVIILIITIIFGRRFFDKVSASNAAAITISCAIVFFLAGASVIDVTLSACILSSMLIFALYYEAPQRKFALMLGVSLALGFLTKGPVAPALFIFAVIPFLILQKSIAQILRYHWGSLFLSFFAVAAPWFLLSEIANPGFFKYFFWNENLARYLITDYGDRYGGGHVHPRGTSWVMLFLSFMPWSVPFIIGLAIKKTRSSLWQSIKTDKWMLYCLCWGLSPAIFFTLGRQLHISYLVPGLPALSLIMARWLELGWSETQKNTLLKILSALSTITVLLFLVLAATQGIDWQLIILVAIPYLMVSMHYHFSSDRKALLTLPHVVFQVCLVFVVAILLSTPIINIRKSTRSILEKVLAESPTGELRIGVVTENNYSPYWLSRKWASEIDNSEDNKSNKRTSIEFVSNSPDIENPPSNLLLKKGSEVNLAPNVFAQYELKTAVGKWRWYVRKTAP